MSNLPRTADEYRNWWERNTDVPYGHCWCGCGEPTNISHYNGKKSLCFAGAPRRFLRGHKTTNAPDYQVEDRGCDTPCWIWQKTKSPSGYGLSHVSKDNNRRAHRVYYEREYGSIPKGKLVHHECEQPLCVNPDHLTVMTPTEHEQTKRNIKITQDQVAEIKELYSKGGLRYEDLANLYDVCTGTIYRALRIR